MTSVNKSLVELKKSNQRRLLYVPFFNFFYVSTKKEDGTSSMERFYDRTEAENYFDEAEKKDTDKEAPQWWWNK